MRPCLVCGKPSRASRCAAHQLPPRNTPEYNAARRIVLGNATVCALCGEPPTLQDPLTLGHIKARAHGGGLELSNLQAEHSSCNKRKGTG